MRRIYLRFDWWVLFFFIFCSLHFHKATAGDSLAIKYCNSYWGSPGIDYWDDTELYIEAYDSIGQLNYFTTSTKNYNDQLFQPQDSTKYLYDNLGRKIYEANLSKWINFNISEEYWYTYDTLNRITHILKNRWQSSTASLVFQAESFYFYSTASLSPDSLSRTNSGGGYAERSYIDSINHLRGVYRYSKDSLGVWSLIGQVRTWYNSNGHDTCIINEKYTTNNGWENYQKTTFTPDSLGRTLSKVDYVWDTDVLVWFAAGITNITYGNYQGYDSLSHYAWSNYDSAYIRWNKYYCEYNSFGNVIQETDSGSGYVGIYQTDYDSLQRIISSRFSNTQGSAHQRRYYYDGAGLMIRSTSFDKTMLGNVSENDCYYYFIDSDSMLIAFPDTVYICAGASKKIYGHIANAKFPLQYSWNPSVEISDSTDLLPVFSPSASRSYILTITDNDGSTYSKQIFVDKLPLPTTYPIDTVALNSTSCFPDTILLIRDDQPGFEYYWTSLNWGVGSNEISNDTISFSRNGGSGSFYYTVIDNHGCKSRSDTIEVFMNLQPNSNFYMSPANFCAGDTIQLAVSPQSNSLIYQWGVNGVDSIGANQPELTVYENGTYTLNVTDTINSCTSSTSRYVRFDNQPPPARIITDSGNVICIGKELTLNSLSVDSSWIYIWWKDNQIISVSHIDSKRIQSGGVYKLYIKSAACVSQPDSIMIFQDNSPTNILTSSLPPYCYPDTIQLTGYSQGQVFYSWSTGDTTANILIDTSGNYVLITMDSLGCVDSDSVSIEIYTPLPKPVIYASGTNLLSSNTTAILQWYLNDTLIPGFTDYVIEPVASGQYKVSATDTTGCITFSDPVNFILLASGQFLSDNNLIIYPIPSSDWINLQYNGVGDPIKFELYDSYSRRLRSEFVPSTEFRVYRQELLEGIYLGRLQIKSAGIMNDYWFRLVFIDK